ncbi:hypothetical protein GUJ93_ZPchr0005g15705 [Zizania palustris]|uniref:Uncharacterized protein n=1 Tax=Zizania palustris TaxID=103762 RepID=A0A8J5SU30_ZIZPA|nr:hypothetical protein GUJ93_ZPchr0005g15705 [Zizania palustris]
METLPLLSALFNFLREGSGAPSLVARQQVPLAAVIVSGGSTKVFPPSSLVAQWRLSQVVVLVAVGSTAALPSSSLATRRQIWALGRRPRRCWLDGGSAILLLGNAAAKLGSAALPGSAAAGLGSAALLPGSASAELGSVALLPSGAVTDLGSATLLPSGGGDKIWSQVIIVVGSLARVLPPPSLVARLRVFLAAVVADAGCRGTPCSGYIAARMVLCRLESTNCRV